MPEEEQDGPWSKKYATATADADEDGPWNKGKAAPAPDDDLGKYLSNPRSASGPLSEEEELPGATPRLRAAVKSGVAKMQPPTQTERDAPKIPEKYGFTLGNVIPAIGRGIGNVVKFGKDIASDISDEQKPLLWGSSEEGPNESTFHKYVIHPSEDQFKEAQRGDISPIESIGHSVAGALPLIGPWAAGKAQQAGTGDVGGAAGEATGEALASKGAERVIAHPAATVKLAGALADKVTRGTPITEAGKIEAAQQQALTVKKPSMNETEYAQRVNEATPELQRIAQENKGKITTPRQAVAAINTRVSQMEAPISNQLAKLTGPGDLVAPGDYKTSIDTAVQQALNDPKKSYKPGELAKAGKEVADLIGDQPKTYEKLEADRRRLNQDADAYYSADTAGKRAIDVSDATAVTQRNR